MPKSKPTQIERRPPLMDGFGIFVGDMRDPVAVIVDPSLAAEWAVRQYPTLRTEIRLVRLFVMPKDW